MNSNPNAHHQAILADWGKGKDVDVKRLIDALHWKTENQRHSLANLHAEFARYKQALQRANGFLILHNLEPVKLEYLQGPPAPHPGPSIEKALARSPRRVETPAHKEPPYYVRTFWSPDRKFLVTANCYILEGETQVTLSLQDDNGDVWEATGPTTDITAVKASGDDFECDQPKGESNVMSDKASRRDGDDR